ncbi:trans-aconitate 2-methyltransferase [Cyanobium sp. Morenito 9A2]|uniref:class I SAM-dependent methyltransferase n=1 Tax=Cyanobium sp. Morenito 9A2 TaxID=2823718 RepID=UPI0020CF2FF2|nr:class I SAM-dependent methyltransferase [Cyanobium sp. Morenito 9A2]MCP9850341.1 class I SAM-dependent methyltransferase [Cyanobium sp. Morenito 9A2]
MLRTEGTALDVGCGSNDRFMSLLQSQGFEVEGLDISSEMLRLARSAAPYTIFHHADICDWILPKTYEFISAWDSIWHVPLGQHRSVLIKLCNGLTSGGVFIFTAGGLESPGEHQDAPMGVPMYHATLGVPHIISSLIEGGCILRHFEYGQCPQPHVYFVAQRG